MHLNPKLTNLEESITLRLNTAAAALQKKGVPVLNLTAGELDFETPPAIRRFVGHILKKNKYTATIGLPELRAAIAKSRRTDASRVAVTAGAKQALAEIFQAILCPGDEVIIPTPTWVSYEHQVRLADGTPVFISLNPATFDLDVRAIKKSITKKTKAIILNSPHNPTGAVFSRTHLEALRRLLHGKKIFIIVDDIYRPLTYARGAVSPARVFAKHPYLIIVDGFSKSHALTGWRIGYFVASKEVVRAVTAYQSHTSGNASVISQYAALACLQSPTIPKTFTHILKERRDLVHRGLMKIKNITWTKPEGAFYFFVNVKQVEKDTMRFCEQLLQEAHVALVPGEAFRLPGFVRLSFTSSETTLCEALRRLKEFIQSSS